MVSMRPKVLVVEDEENLLKLYKLELEEEGFEVITAPSVNEGLKFLESEPVDVLVLDIMFPEGSSVERIDEFLQRNKKLKVIINTAYPTFKFDFKTWAADAFVTKSSDLGELKDTIRKLLTKNSNSS